MFFKPEFKEKMLDGTMCAFISDEIKLEIGVLYHLHADGTEDRASFVVREG